jgi:WD40 repeat protein
MGVWKIPSLEGPPMWRAFTALQSPRACAFSADHRFLAAATQYGELLLWDLSTRKRMVLPRTLTFYHSLAFSPDGSRLAAATDTEAKMFDTAIRQEVFAFKQPGLQLAFTRDGEKLLAVNSKAAFVLDAPPLAQLQFGWLKEKPSQEAPPYFGPHLDQPRPSRPPPPTPNGR